jgi:electron transfer flavoprotein-quinone oxidoreductase
MDFAIASGYYAAQAVVAAKKAGDCSAAGLAGYEQSLRQSFVLRDLETARHIPRLMENPRLFTHYPQAVSRLLESVFTIGPQPSRRLVKTVWRGVRKDFLSIATLKDMWRMRKL